MNQDIKKQELKLANSSGIAAILLWSMSIGLIRSITEAFGASAGAALIYSLSALFVISFKGLPKINRLTPIYLLGCGFLFISYEIFLSQALGMADDRHQSLELALINYLWPCLTIFFAIFFKLQKSTILLWLGVLLSFTGIYWVLAGGEQTSLINILEHMQINPVAYVFAFLAAITWALYCNLARKYGDGQNAVSLFLAGTGGCLWLYYFYSGAPSINFTVKGTAELLFIGAATACAYGFWNYAIQRGSLVLLATASYFTPLLSMLFASIWLGTALSLFFWQAACMVTLGAFISWLGTQSLKRLTAKYFHKKEHHE